MIYYKVAVTTRIFGGYLNWETTLDSSRYRRRQKNVLPSGIQGQLPWAAAQGGGGRRDQFPAMFSTFNIMPMGVAWKESTSNDPRPPQSLRRGAALAATT